MRRSLTTPAAAEAASRPRRTTGTAHPAHQSMMRRPLQPRSLLCLFSIISSSTSVLPQNSMHSIVPELAEWSWNENRKRLAFRLREGVRSSPSRQATRDLLLGKAKGSLRRNPRQGWYKNVADVTVIGDKKSCFLCGAPSRHDRPHHLRELPVWTTLSALT